MARSIYVITVAALSVAYLGCGGEGESTGPDEEPTTGSVRVAASTSGQDVDPNGYRAVIEDADSQGDLSANGSVTLRGIAPGSYTVVLERVAVNCPVRDGTEREVTVTAGQETSVTFEVQCETAPRIVFVWAREDDPGIYTAKVNGTEVELVASDAWGFARPNRVAEVVPSPDGSQVVFNPENDGVILLDLEDGTSESLPQSDDAAFFSATWSSDGSRIAFARNGRLQIHRVEDGQLLRALSPGEDRRVAGGAAWSPTNAWIAAETEVDREGSDETRIEVFAPDGSERAVLAEERGFNILPSNGARRTVWSPDGDRLAFANFVLGSREEDVFVAEVAADGSAARVDQIRSDPGEDEGATFSPDGEWLAFLSERGPRDNEKEIYRVRPDGSDLQQLTDEGMYLDRAPAWARDGEIVLALSQGGTVIAVRANGENLTRVVGSAGAPVTGVAWR